MKREGGRGTRKNIQSQGGLEDEHVDVWHSSKSNLKVSKELKVKDKTSASSYPVSVRCEDIIVTQKRLIP